MITWRDREAGGGGGLCRHNFCCVFFFFLVCFLLSQRVHLPGTEGNNYVYIHILFSIPYCVSYFEHATLGARVCVCLFFHAYAVVMTSFYMENEIYTHARVCLVRSPKVSYVIYNTRSRFPKCHWPRNEHKILLRRFENARTKRLSEFRKLNVWN